MFMRVHLGWPQSGVLDPATDLGAMTSGSRIVMKNMMIYDIVTIRVC